MPVAGACIDRSPNAPDRPVLDSVSVLQSWPGVKRKAAGGLRRGSGGASSRRPAHRVRWKEWAAMGLHLSGCRSAADELSSPNHTDLGRAGDCIYMTLSS